MRACGCCPLKLRFRPALWRIRLGCFYKNKNRPKRSVLNFGSPSWTTFELYCCATMTKQSEISTNFQNGLKITSDNFSLIYTVNRKIYPTVSKLGQMAYQIALRCFCLLTSIINLYIKNTSKHPNSIRLVKKATADERINPKASAPQWHPPISAQL